MYTPEEKQDKILDAVRQDIEMAKFFGLSMDLGLMDGEQWLRDFKDAWEIELVADRLSYTGFWHKQQELLYHPN